MRVEKMPRFIVHADMFDLIGAAVLVVVFTPIILWMGWIIVRKKWYDWRAKRKKK